MRDESRMRKSVERQIPSEEARVRAMASVLIPLYQKWVESGKPTKPS